VRLPHCDRHGRSRDRTDDQRRVNQDEPPAVSHPYDAPGQPGDNAIDIVALAREVVLGPSAANIRALADAVLEREDVRLALAVREGGPFAARRGIELAAQVLADAIDARDANAEVGG
jgi:hypothetical protein